MNYRLRFLNAILYAPVVWLVLAVVALACGVVWYVALLLCIVGLVQWVSTVELMQWMEGWIR